MNILDVFKWVVRLPSKPAGFFVPLCPPCPLGNYLVRIKSDLDGCRPEFSDLPALYPACSARFLVRELRRVGYNVRRCPFVILMVRDALRSLVSRLKAHAADRSKWK